MNAAELTEIDENLARAELSPAEEDLHIKRRKEVRELVQRRRTPFVKSNCTTNEKLRKDGRKKGEQHKKKFATELAEVTGDASSGLRQKIARARELGSDLHKVAGTSLDKGIEMDALINQAFSALG
jgi:hypothetical protein